MVKEDSEWVDLTNKQLHIEAGAGGSKKKLSLPFGPDIHAPVEPIPDNDWVGETWGLYWPDQEMEERAKQAEDPTKFIKKHYEAKTNDHPPADLQAKISENEIMTCPRDPTPPPPPRDPTPPPPVVLRKKKTPPPPPSVTVFDQDVDNDNSKWNWLRSSDKSAGRARFSLSIYW